MKNWTEKIIIAYMRMVICTKLVGSIDEKLLTKKSKAEEECIFFNLMFKNQFYELLDLLLRNKNSPRFNASGCCGGEGGIKY